MDRFRVRIIKMTGRPFLVAEWRDPESGKLKRQSTKTKTHREAERFAANLERKLNDGEFMATAAKWEDFRRQYVHAHKDRWAAKTKRTVATALNALERILSPKYVRSVTSAGISKMSAQLDTEGLSPAGIGSMFRHIKAALRWAARKGMIHKVPDIEMPEGALQCGGRAISGEEFDRLLEAVAKVVKPEFVGGWRHFLRLLWVSGLRIGEAIKLHWTDDSEITPDLRGKYPMFLIQPETSKNGKRERFPMAPEAYSFLLETPEGLREGYVSNPLVRGQRANYENVVPTVSAIGRAAGVVVARDKAGEPRYCSAHDLRRSAATRWAAKVTPSVLQAMMRHSCPMTTARYYTDRAGEPIAEAIWQSLGNSPRSDAAPTIETTTGEAGNSPSSLRN